MYTGFHVFFDGIAESSLFKEDVIREWELPLHGHLAGTPVPDFNAIATAKFALAGRS
jgi:hypothetical protein